MKQTRPFNILIANSSGSFFQLPKKELARHNLNITRPLSNKDFDRFIDETEFDLIIVRLDSNKSPDKKVTATVRRLAKRQPGTPILAALNATSVDHKLMDQLFEAGINDFIFDNGYTNPILLKIQWFQQLILNNSIHTKDVDQLKKENFRLTNENEKLKLQSQLDKKQIRKAHRELAKEINENVKSTLDLKAQSKALSERIKELDCLVTITRHSEDEKLSIDSFFKEVANTIVIAFPYPEKTFAEIKYKDQLYPSHKFKRTKLAISREIKYRKKTVGSIYVYCAENVTPIANQSSTKEKKQLLSSIAKNLGQIIHRKETEGRLKIFQRAVDQSPMMISVTNVKTAKIEYINPKFTKVHGYTMNDFKDRNPFLDTSDEKYNERVGDIIATIRNGKNWFGTYQNLDKNGEIFWQKTSIFALSENGHVTHALGLSEDISDEIRRTEELKISKDNYEHIAENVPGGIIILDTNGKILYANKKATEITAYPVPELCQLNLQNLSIPSAYTQAKQRLSQRLKGLHPKNNFETQILTKNGVTKIVESSGVKTRWMGEIADLIVFHDITKKKHFSDLLNIQSSIDYLSTIPVGLDESFKQIFKTLFRYNWIDSGGIYLMNDDNDRLDLVFHKGLSAEFLKEIQHIRQDSDRFQLVLRKKALLITSANAPSFPENLAKEGIKAIFIFPLIHEKSVLGVLNLASKSQTELSEHERMIFESIGTRIAQMVALIKTQEELQFKNRKLQQTLNEIKEKQQLLIQKSKLESLGEMAAGVAHEINQPLGVIFLSLENILFKIADKNISQNYLDKKLNSITKNIKKIKEIIDHIRTFSRDQKSIIIERVNINDVIKKACSMIEEHYLYHNIQIELALQEGLGFTLGNNHKLEQVMYNLFSNAKFALEDKEFLMTDKKLDKKIKIRTHCNTNKIFVEFEDNGIGIEKDKLEKIFNPFFTTKPEGIGTGLGLSIVYGIITEMKGSIYIESKRKKFTRVLFEFPKYTTTTR